MTDGKIYAIVDVEVGLKDKKIHDIGAVRSDGAIYHHAYRQGLMDFISGAEYICGHNIIHHDLEYLSKYISSDFVQKPVIDTLRLSSLIFIRKPYHKLIKEYKKPIDPEREDELDSFFMRHIP